MDMGGNGEGKKEITQRRRDRRRRERRRKGFNTEDAEEGHRGHRELGVAGEKVGALFAEAVG